MMLRPFYPRRDARKHHRQDRPGPPEGERVTHQPKGGMCASCQHALRDCSALPFDQMPVIERAPAAVIVRCTQHKRRADGAK